MPKIVGISGKEMTKGTFTSPTRESSSAKGMLDTLTAGARKLGRKVERREVQRPPRMMLGTRG